ncbi:hypothetical protein [Leifsonia sp. 22587]|uniref:hypothetical protein n=1 Tax=Leifsonia sp. 22587 TaxID=3453946 RepID=UPI003F82F057
MAAVTVGCTGTAADRHTLGLRTVSSHTASTAVTTQRQAADLMTAAAGLHGPDRTQFLKTVEGLADANEKQIRQAVLPSPAVPQGSGGPAHPGTARAGDPLGDATIAAGVIGYTALGAGISSGMDLAGSDQAETTSSTGDIATGNGTQISVENGVMRGTVAATTTQGTDAGTVAMTTTTAFSLTVCPDASGTADASADMHSTVTGDAGSIGMHASLDLHVEAKGTVDDDAELARLDVSTGTTVAAGAHSTGVNGGVYLEARDGYSLTGAPSAIDFTSASASAPRGPGIVRSSSRADAARRAAVVQVNQQASLLTVQTLYKKAIAFWQGGHCVDLPVSSDKGTHRLKPKSEAALTARPKSKIDGAETGGTITASLTSGGTSVSPATPVKAPSKHTFVAPGAINKTGVVHFIAKSKRGIAQTDLSLDTNVEGYRIATSVQGMRIEGSKCGPIDGDWTIRFDATPSGIPYTGSISAHVQDGAGPYVLTGESRGTQFTHTGTGTIAFSSEGGLHATVTPQTGSVVMNADKRIHNNRAGEPMTIPVTEDPSACQP